MTLPMSAMPLAPLDCYGGGNRSKDLALGQSLRHVGLQYRQLELLNVHQVLARHPSGTARLNRAVA